MSSETLCFVLVAIAMCTVHLCLGVWIGWAFENGRRQTFLPRTDRAKTQGEVVSELGAAYLKNLRGPAEAVADGYLKFPPRIEMVAAAVAPSATPVHIGTESMDRFLVSARRTAANGAAPGRTALVPALCPKANGTAGPKHQTAFEEKFRYEVWQYVAPYREGSLPSPELFEKVLCRELSNTGFSFFSEEPPDYKTLVVALGRLLSLRFFVSQVTHSVSVSVHGRGMHLVTCQFSRKLSDVYHWDEGLGEIALIAAGSGATIRPSMEPAECAVC